MSCVARRTRSQAQKSPSSLPPTALGSGKRRNGGKFETVVLSSQEDGNDKEDEEEEGRQSGFVGRSVGRKRTLGSAKKRRLIARRNGGKSEALVLSNEEDDKGMEEEEKEVVEGQRSGSVGRNVGRKRNLGSARKRRRIARRNGGESETVVLSSEDDDNDNKNDGDNVTNAGATDEDAKCRLLNNCVSRRTRSNFKKTPIGRFGSFREPICIDMDDSPKKGIREMGSKTSRKQKCDYIDDYSSSCDDSEDDENEESDRCFPIGVFHSCEERYVGRYFKGMR